MTSSNEIKQKALLYVLRRIEEAAGELRDLEFKNPYESRLRFKAAEKLVEGFQITKELEKVYQTKVEQLSLFSR